MIHCNDYQSRMFLIFMPKESTKIGKPKNILLPSNYLTQKNVYILICKKGINVTMKAQYVGMAICYLKMSM